MTKRTFLREVKRAIHELDPQAEVWLFGSRARGDARPDSDWDLLMLTDKPVDRAFKYKVWDHLNDLELELEQVISTRIYNKAAWTSLGATDLYKNIRREGIRL